MSLVKQQLLTHPEFTTVLFVCLTFFFAGMLDSYRRSNKYQFYSLWFDPTGARTHDLPHSRRTLTITPPMLFGIWKPLFGIWIPPFGICIPPFGIWIPLFGICKLFFLIYFGIESLSKPPYLYIIDRMPCTEPIGCFRICFNVEGWLMIFTHCHYYWKQC